MTLSEIDIILQGSVKVVVLPYVDFTTFSIGS